MNPLESYRLNFALGGPTFQVTPSSVQLAAGGTAQLSATYSAGGGVPAGPVTPAWSSADPSVAAISPAATPTTLL